MGMSRFTPMKLFSYPYVHWELKAVGGMGDLLTMEVKPQQLNAPTPMYETFDGKVIVVKELQPAKAHVSSRSTEFGMVMAFNSFIDKKALWPIMAMSLGMTVFLHPLSKVFVAVSIKALQLLRLS